MICSVDVECAHPDQILRCVSRFECALDLARMEEDGWIAIAFQYFVLHALVAGRVSALPSGCVDQDLPLSHARGGIEEQLPALQLEGAVGGMQAAAQRPVNLSLRRIEFYLQPLVLAVVLRVGKL